MSLTHLDAKYSLSQQHVSCGGVDIVIAGITRVDHESIHKLHGLGTLSS